MSYTQPHKAQLAPATQALLELMRTAKLQTPSGPTVAGQAVMNAQGAGATAEPPPEAGPEQQGIASILDQAKAAGPTIAQNQQDAQAQKTAQMAAQMVNQEQQPQTYAAGGIADLPVEVGDFAEGGVLGYAGGGIAEPTASSAADWVSQLAPKQDPEMEAEAKRLYEERKALAAARPDTAAQRALAMKEAYNKEVAYRPTEENIASWLGGAQGLGGFAKAAVSTREAFAKRDAANKEGEQAQRDLEYAQKIGDNEAIEKALSARRAAKMKYDEYAAAITGDTLKAQSGIFNVKTDAASQAANRAAQERIARIQASARGGGGDRTLADKIEDNVRADLEDYYKNNPSERIALRKHPELADVHRAKIREKVIANMRASGADIPDAAFSPAKSDKPAQKEYRFTDITN